MSKVSDRLLTAREVAEILGVSAETVLRWVRGGKLPAIRLPSGAIRFDPDQLDAWKQERATLRRGVSPTPASAAQPIPYVASPTPEGKE